MMYKEQNSANCWVMFDREYRSIKFSVSNGLKFPAALIQKAHEFIDTIKRNAFTPLALDLEQNIIWPARAIQICETDFGEEEIACVFNEICKAANDCTPPFLSLIYGNKTIEDAVADFQMVQKISIALWSFNIKSASDGHASGQNLQLVLMQTGGRNQRSRGCVVPTRYQPMHAVLCQP